MLASVLAGVTEPDAAEKRKATTHEKYDTPVQGLLSRAKRNRFEGTMNIRAKRLMSGLAAVVACLFSAGCGTMKIPAYPGGPAVHGQTREAQGLALVADPFADKQRTETYFKFNAEGKGIAIVHLRAENHSPDSAWLLNEENMHLIDQAGVLGMNAHDQGVKSDYGAANAVGMTGAVLLSLPMMIAGNKLIADAMVVEKNFVDKEWHNQTLSPGQSAEGFIYFNFGKKTNWLDGASLRVDCLNTRNQQTNTIILPLAYETK